MIVGCSQQPTGRVKLVFIFTGTTLLVGLPRFTILDWTMFPRVCGHAIILRHANECTKRCRGRRSQQQHRRRSSRKISGFTLKTTPSATRSSFCNTQAQKPKPSTLPADTKRDNRHL